VEGGISRASEFMFTLPLLGGTADRLGEWLEVREMNVTASVAWGCRFDWIHVDIE